MAKHTVLKQYFGHTDFRPGQEELIDGILAGRDALGIMPTGGGKSLCYQIPALLLPGLTLVISPLISLMKDQVTALNGVGIPAAFLNSSLDSDGFRQVCREIRQGMHKLIYVAPERLGNEGFLALMQEQNVALVAVDEAHCISQWGQDFRPSYLKITAFVDQLPRRPVLSAFTATATAEVQEDILQRLALRDPVKVVTGFDRPNLFFDVRHPKKKDDLLLALVEERREKSGIVYCATRAGVEKVCDLLNRRGILATRYHAGLAEEERRQNQDDFQFDRKAVMVATNAFGMGIDKSNVGFVIHYNMPKSLEAYYQEAGRAGRDGEAADCILLYGPGDVSTAKFFIQQAGEENEALSPLEVAQIQARDYRRLEAMVDYCKSTACLRGHILDYFGQAHGPTCGNCGPCRGQFVRQDITRQAQMILSCVKRVRDRLGYFVGAGLISKVLRGSRDRRLMQLGLDTLSTYGLLKGTTAGELGHYFAALEAEGYLFTELEHSTLRLTPKAGEVLFRGAQVTMTRRAEPEAAISAPAAAQPVEDSLMAALKATRWKLAQGEGVPLYVIFSNATLADMARRRPRTMEDFLEVSGVGQVKAEKYGRAFLQTLADHRAGEEE
ncbi:MAG: DNA helicase RecQ [Clostridiales bacterium]|nr:DNA helicase RecQ [Clostridiales bacterium]MDY4171778.1 DNA helicase RecQ [Evtepia sp.]